MASDLIYFRLSTLSFPASEFTVDHRRLGLSNPQVVRLAISLWNSHFLIVNICCFE